MTHSQGSEDNSYQGWAILELMGHVKLAGKLSEQKLAGMSFLKIDIPARPGTAVEGEFSATQFINPSSIYRLHPVAEEVARAVAASIAPDPVTKWDVKALLPSPALDRAQDEAEDYSDDDEDDEEEEYQ
jgi:hypothetical protein